MTATIAPGLDGRHPIDITTTGRRTGEARRIEIAIHNIDGRLYISGMPSPRTRAWIYNLESDPRMTVHVKAPGARQDLPATARVISDATERREIMPFIAANWRRTDIDKMVEWSPLIEVTLD